MKFDPERIEKLVELFHETSAAHAETLDDPDAYDPQWAAWFAGHIREGLNELLGADLEEQKIATLLGEAEQEHIVTSPGRDWAAYYADFFIARAM